MPKSARSLTLRRRELPPICLTPPSDKYTINAMLAGIFKLIKVLYFRFNKIKEEINHLISLPCTSVEVSQFAINAGDLVRQHILIEIELSRCWDRVKQLTLQL
jgi:hypothetical protein